MEFEKLELDNLIDALEPYQQELVKELVNNYGLDGALDKWLTAQGPVNMVKFGGVQEKENNFKERYKNEINKFLCGHPDYQNERKEFGKINDSSKTIVISGLSAFIGSKLGVAATVISPAIVISLGLAGKMGIKAYCSGISFE